MTAKVITAPSVVQNSSGSTATIAKRSQNNLKNSPVESKRTSANAHQGAPFNKEQVHQLKDIEEEIHSTALFVLKNNADVHYHDFDLDKILRWMRDVTSEVERLSKVEGQWEEDVEVIKNLIIVYAERYEVKAQQQLKASQSPATSFVLSEVWKNMKNILEILNTEKESRSSMQKQEVIDEHNFETTAAQVSFDDEEKQEKQGVIDDENNFERSAAKVSFEQEEKKIIFEEEITSNDRNELNEASLNLQIISYFQDVQQPRNYLSEIEHQRPFVRYKKALKAAVKLCQRHR